MQLYRQTIIAFDQILHLDMYTGYGPRYQMILVNSALEFRSSEEFEQKFIYPVVVAANPEEFYANRGDMIELFYEWLQQEAPQKRVFTTVLEFDTLGNA